jgi:hypothetical protein
VDVDTLQGADRTLRVLGTDQDKRTVTVNVESDRAGRNLAGTDLTWFVYSEPTLLGARASQPNGELTLKLPNSLEQGTHTLVALRADNTVATWGTFEWTGDTNALAFTGSSPFWVIFAGSLALITGATLIGLRRARRTNTV